MDIARLDYLARSLTTSRSRRGLLRGLAAGLGLAAIHLPGSADAKNRKKHKSKKRCQRLGQSCSPGGKRKCCEGAGAICDDTSLDRFRCCKADGEACSERSECCANECELGVCTPS